MTNKKSTHLRPLPGLASLFAAVLFLTNPTPAAAQCGLPSSQEFASWFQSGAVTPNGAVKAPQSVNFDDPGVQVQPRAPLVQPNCPFYLWALRTFLWATSPTSPVPANTNISGGRVLNSQAFYEVSVRDKNGHRSFITHAPGAPAGLNVPLAQLGPSGLPVTFAKTGQMLELEPTKLGPTGRPLVMSSTGATVEVGRVTLDSAGKPIFTDTFGRPISRPASVAQTAPLRATVAKPAILKRRTVQRFFVNQSPIYLDPLGNVVEVEQGQSDKNWVLMTQTGSLVYYSISVNDLYAYFMTGAKTGGFTRLDPTFFPTTAEELNEILNYVGGRGLRLLNPSALAVVVKTAWVELSMLPNPTTYIAAQATVPDYDKSNPNLWVVRGSKTVQVGLVGIHVVGSLPGHREMVWSTFEHIFNEPTDASVNMPRVTTGNWLFSAGRATDPFNIPHMSVDPATGNIAAIPPFSISPSNTMRAKMSGAAIDKGPNPLAPTQESNLNIQSVNSLLGNLSANDARRYYLLIGATWTSDGTAPTGSWPSGNEVGTSKLSNATMETYFQGDNTFGTGTTCFDCHNGIGTSDSLSHIFADLTPLTLPPPIMVVQPKLLSLAAKRGTDAQESWIIVQANDKFTNQSLSGNVSVMRFNAGKPETQIASGRTGQKINVNCEPLDVAVGGAGARSTQNPKPGTCDVVVTVPGYPVGRLTVGTPP
jgi:hypothetical protein